jgi:hypothetical protein
MVVSAELLVGKTVTLEGKAPADFLTILDELGTNLVPKVSRGIDFVIVCNEIDDKKRIAAESAARKAGVRAITEAFVRECHRLVAQDLALARWRETRPPQRPQQELVAAARRHAASLEATYGARLPERYLDLIDTCTFARLGLLQLTEGFVRGTFELDFIDPRLIEFDRLADDLELDIDLARWKATYREFVPVATLRSVYAERRSDNVRGVRAFLVMGTIVSCPILLWHWDGPRLYPIAVSLDDFVRGQAGEAALDHPALSMSYETITWISV